MRGCSWESPTIYHGLSVVVPWKLCEVGEKRRMVVVAAGAINFILRNTNAHILKGDAVVVEEGFANNNSTVL